MTFLHIFFILHIRFQIIKFLFNISGRSFIHTFFEYFYSLLCIVGSNIGICKFYVQIRIIRLYINRLFKSYYCFIVIFLSQIFLTDRKLFINLYLYIGLRKNHNQGNNYTYNHYTRHGKYSYLYGFSIFLFNCRRFFGYIHLLIYCSALWAYTVIFIINISTLFTPYHYFSLPLSYRKHSVQVNQVTAAFSTQNPSVKNWRCSF